MALYYRGIVEELLRKRWVRQFWLRCRVRPLAASLSYPLVYPQEEATGLSSALMGECVSPSIPVLPHRANYTMR